MRTNTQQALTVGHRSTDRGGPSTRTVRSAAAAVTVAALLGRADAALAEARAADAAADRFSLAHLAALRGAAALLADRGRPSAQRRRLVSAWVLVEAIAPEFGEWAEYFAAGAPARAAIEAGALRVVSARAADDQVRAAEEFLTLIAAAVGVLAVPLAS
jgi:SAV_6107-like HEPN